MSFDIFLNCFDNGQPSTFSRKIVEDAFASFVTTREPDRWVLSDSLADVWIDDDPEIGGLGVSRPPGDENHPFWRGLLEVMRQTPTVLFWPASGKPAALVAQASVITHMPPDMIEALGTPPVIDDPSRFWEYIHDSG